MECQICQVPLREHQKEGFTVHQCEKCEGFWVPKGVLNQLVPHKHGDIEKSSVDHHYHDDTHDTLKCAFCADQATIKCNFIAYSDIIFDHCEACGAFWIDRGELDKMKAYMETLESNPEKSGFETLMSLLYSLPRL